MADITKVREPEKLVRLVNEYAINGGNLMAAARRCGVKYQCARQWQKNGFIDPSNQDHALALATKVGPERAREIAENAYELVVQAQVQVGKKLKDATARDASQIAVQQHGIGQLATGQATARIEMYDRNQLIADLEALGNTVEGTAEEIEEVTPA